MGINLTYSLDYDKNKGNLSEKKRVIAVTAAAAAAATLLVAATSLGSAQFSNQQQQEEEDERRSDLASSSNATTGGNVKLKTNDLDFSAREGQGGGVGRGFTLQTTERSNSLTVANENQQGDKTVSVQCNSDEFVTGGGYSFEIGTAPTRFPIESKRLDNGWTVTWEDLGQGAVVTVYAECLKVVNGGTTG